LLRENINLFYNLYSTEEDLRKAKLYSQENKRKKIKIEFKNIEDYISSLELKITVAENDALNISRLAQLTQKTNQFNLTTKRYSEVDIETFLKDPEKVIYSVSAEDKYGSYGTTGLVILIIKENKAIIDTFLMSCRILGRNIEFVLMDFIINKLKTKNITTIKAEYIKTKKNHNVESFYKNCSLETQNISEETINHSLKIINYKKSRINYIKIKENGK
jgi:FkbH-like protein